MKYRVLYRGPLSSCNYDCGYCPFAKRSESYSQLASDRESLKRFLDWIELQSHHEWGVLFTPWGEALVRPWYRDALIRLTSMPQVHRAAIQTNLSCNLDWISQCDPNKLAFWATFHPLQVSLKKFFSQVQRVVEHGVRLSVGVVGVREHFDFIDRLRQQLPQSVYLWVNAFKDQTDYYQSDETAFLEQFDPLFPTNNQRHHSLGEPCGAGETSFTVDSEGAIRRCHFVKDPIGHIDDPNWEQALRPRTCPQLTCGCHIGYVNLKRLDLESTYGEGVLERIPKSLPQSRNAIT